MLTQFRLVHTDGLKGLFFGGDLLPFDKIDDTLAEQLLGKTHVLERVPVAPDAAPPAATPPPTEETASPGRKGKS